ncbi:MAG: ATP phosphoribosyltransferase [Nannocystis sp.]|nr:ATP phosphoribosyltransferase [Nannocystis sp.]MBA3544847.1 ATP phosphoribosyltransferase [Nannocystis sp.]
MAPPTEGLTLALPKGRILAQAIPLLRQAGLDLTPLLASGHDRRLLFDLPGGLRVLLVKPVDVPTYVEHGVADLGIAGYDTLCEEARDLYEPVDLGVGACRLVVAEPAERPVTLRRGMQLRVATKYPRLTLRHYRSRGIQPEIIPLAGSVELGPITGLSDQIVDLVESGETLRQNNLRETDTILHVTSRLIVHPASLKLKQAAITRTIAAVRAAALTPARTA